MFRLRARPARARMQAISELSQWLKDTCHVDPAEPCRGSTAVQILFGRLLLEHGNTSVDFRGEHLLVGAKGVISSKSVREYIWGVTQEIITADDDEELEDTKKLDGAELLEGAVAVEEEESEEDDSEDEEDEDGQE